MSFRQAARGYVINLLESLFTNVEVLSFLILLLRTGSDLDRSSPKHKLRCLEGSKTEEVLR
jgi:hypothetical protein